MSKKKNRHKAYLAKEPDRRFQPVYNKKVQIFRKIKYYLFCVKWLYQNRNWDDNRHKFKAMNREWNRRERIREGNLRKKRVIKEVNLK